ncbi:MAG: 4-hydroxy-3-methylbut-2-enyl diphosphate reductase [Anaerolineales bacterium]|nr:4-hydroxy-3-methylbut-2-enyl diphosphate reductase [Anaerolineales bacterium]
MRVILANPRGFCAGVVRAIDIVEAALREYGAPIYVRHEIVHNQFVLARLRRQGVKFVAELDEVPDDGVVIFSAHGVGAAVYQEARRRNLTVVDATCPLVTKVHHQVEKLLAADFEVIVIGHAGHPEIIGTLGRAARYQAAKLHLIERLADVASLRVSDSTKLGYVTQTTLSVDDTREIISALRRRFPTIVAPPTDDICYATQNRQDAVRLLADTCDVVLVIGSANSSNSNSLRDVALQYGKPAYLIDGPNDIDTNWFNGKTAIGLTAGASAPPDLIELVLTKLRELGAAAVEELSAAQENVVFRLPKLPAKSKRLGIPILVRAPHPVGAVSYRDSSRDSSIESTLNLNQLPE